MQQHESRAWQEIGDSLSNIGFPESDASRFHHEGEKAPPRRSVRRHEHALSRWGRGMPLFAPARAWLSGAGASKAPPAVQTEVDCRRVRSQRSASIGPRRPHVPNHQRQSGNPRVARRSRDPRGERSGERRETDSTHLDRGQPVEICRRQACRQLQRRPDAIRWFGSAPGILAPAFRRRRLARSWSFGISVLTERRGLNRRLLGSLRRRTRTTQRRVVPCRRFGVAALGEEGAGAHGPFY